MTLEHATIATPAGPFTMVVRDDGVLASGWSADVDELLSVVAPSLRPRSTTARRDLGPVTAAARSYLEGDVGAIDTVPVVQESGPFIVHAWKVLREVPAGRPITYAELAHSCGRPGAIRAAGSACARNAVALFVPCHRVLRTGGALGGFRWGLAVKRWLLDHESASCSL